MTTPSKRLKIVRLDEETDHEYFKRLLEAGARIKKELEEERKERNKKVTRLYKLKD